MRTQNILGLHVLTNARRFGSVANVMLCAQHRIHARACALDDNVVGKTGPHSKTTPEPSMSLELYCLFKPNHDVIVNAVGQYASKIHSLMQTVKMEWCDQLPQEIDADGGWVCNSANRQTVLNTFNADLMIIQFAPDYVFSLPNPEKQKLMPAPIKDLLEVALKEKKHHGGQKFPYLPYHAPPAPRAVDEHDLERELVKERALVKILDRALAKQRAEFATRLDDLNDVLRGIEIRLSRNGI